LKILNRKTSEGAASVAKKALIVKQKRKPKFQTRSYNRCFRCGRPRGYM